MAPFLLVVACAIFAASPGTGLAQVKTTAAAPVSPDPLKVLARDYDKMRGIAWYQHPSSPKFTNANGFFLYFGKEDATGLMPLHLVARYKADSWLFVKQAWAKADGTRIDFPQVSERFMGWKRDNGSGGIWEWSDATLTSSAEIAQVRQLAFAKDVTVRFEGKEYYGDRTLSAQQLAAMRAVIAAYEAASGKPWK